MDFTSIDIVISFLSFRSIVSRSSLKSGRTGPTPVLCLLQRDDLYGLLHCGDLNGLLKVFKRLHGLDISFLFRLFLFGVLDECVDSDTFVFLVFLLLAWIFECLDLFRDILKMK